MCIYNIYFPKNQKIVSHYTPALKSSTVVKFLEFSKQKTPRTFFLSFVFHYSVSFVINKKFYSKRKIVEAVVFLRIFSEF